MPRWHRAEPVHDSGQCGLVDEPFGDSSGKRRSDEAAARLGVAKPAHLVPEHLRADVDVPYLQVVAVAPAVPFAGAQHRTVSAAYGAPAGAGFMPGAPVGHQDDLDEVMAVRGHRL